MSKQRIYEYAKELNLKSKEIIDELKSMNIEVSNHMQALEDDQIKALDKKFKKEQKNDNKQSTQNNHQKSNNQAIKRIIEIIRKITRIINHKINQLLQKKYHQK